MSAYSETVNVIMKSRVRESRTHGSVRGWHREVPVYSTNDKGKPCKMAHLKRLNRLGTLMSGLSNEDIPLWEKKDNEESGDVQEYVTAKDSYKELFPGLSERTRQRDFQVLRNIGYNVFYNPVEHCFYHDEYRFPLGWVDVPDEIDDDFVNGTW